LHSKSVEVPEPIQNAVYGTYKTAKRYRPQDIDQKHFADRYGTEYIDYWGRGRDHHTVHLKERHASDTWQRKNQIPFDKRIYNTFNQVPKNCISRNENISLNNNEIH